MSTKQIPFRLDDSKLIAFDSKLSDKGMKRQTFFAKCVELFIEDKLSLDSNELLNDSSEVSNDNNEIAELKKQIAVILERLDRIENDSNVIAFDTTIVNDNNELSNDSLSIQSENKEDNTESIALLKCDILPLNEDSPQMIPLSENKAVNGDIPVNDTELTEEKFIQLLKKHEIPAIKENEETEVIDNELLYPFFSELLGKKVDSKSLSKVANKDKHYLASAFVWEYFTVEKVKGKWQWTRIK